MEWRNSLCDIGGVSVDMAITETSPPAAFLQDRRGAPSPKPRLIRADQPRVAAESVRPLISAIAFPPEPAWRAVHDIAYADADANGLYDRADAQLDARDAGARDVMAAIAQATQAVVLAAASETQDDDAPAHDALERARQIAKAHPQGAELARTARQWMVDTPARLIAYTTFTERGGE